MSTPHTTDTPHATIAEYRALADQGAGPAAQALFARLSPADQATVRAENIARYSQRPIGSRFD